MTKTLWDVYNFSGGKIGQVEADTFELARAAARSRYPREGERIRVYRAKVDYTGPKLSREERLARRLPRR